jgi:hypothetical protein
VVANPIRRIAALMPGISRFRSRLGEQDKKRLWTELETSTKSVQGLEGPPSAADVLNYLLKTGTDYPGQVNYAFQTQGYSGLLGAKIDALAMGLTAIGLGFVPVTGSFRPELTAKGARHRLVIVAYQNDKTPSYPNTTPLCLAEMQGVTGTLRVQLGIEVGPQWKSPTLDIPGLEQLGFSFSIKATAGASGGYEGTYLRVWDAAPKYYSRNERGTRLQNDVRAVLSGSGTKEGEKAPPFFPLCSFAMWTQSGDVGASIDAELKAKAVLNKTVGAEVKPQAKGPKIQRTWKWSGYRLQTIGANGVVMTQDAELTYKKLSTQILQLETEVKGTLTTQNAYSSKSFKDMFGLKKKTDKYVPKSMQVNTLSYRAGVLFWHHSDVSARLLAGSGYQIGQSVSLPSLVALFDGSLDEDRWTEFIVNLASSLKVEPDQMGEFLTDSSDIIASLALDPKAKPSALLIEANFHPGDANLNWFPKSEAERDQPPPFLDTFAQSALTLESIRLRYRMSDASSKDSTVFKLGVNPGLVEAYIQLDRIEQYGSEGIVDLQVTSFAGQTVQPAVLIA